MSQWKIRDLQDSNYAKLHRQIEFLTELADKNIPELQKQIRKLRKITTEVEGIHRASTVGSLSGNVVATVGGVIAVAGLALAPFTFGASLVATEVGAVVGVIGGVTSATCNILNTIHKNVSRNDIQEALLKLKADFSAVTECLEDIQRKVERLSLENVDEFCIRSGKIKVGEIVENIMEAAEQITTTLRAVTAVFPAVSSLFIVLDIFFVVNDFRELKELNNPPSISEVKSNTVKFLQKMKETIKITENAVDDIKSVIEKLQRLPPPRANEKRQHANRNAPKWWHLAMTGSELCWEEVTDPDDDSD